MPLNYQYPNFQNYQQQQPQQNAFVMVRSEEEARSYPVAPGNSITFMSENSPYVFSKTMGFNQLDRPVFKKYKLVEEEISQQGEPEKESAVKISSEELEAKFGQIWGELDQIKNDIKSIRSYRNKRQEKKGGISDE